MKNSIFIIDKTGIKAIKPKTEEQKQTLLKDMAYETPTEALLAAVTMLIVSNNSLVDRMRKLEEDIKKDKI